LKSIQGLIGQLTDGCQLSSSSVSAGACCCVPELMTQLALSPGDSVMVVTSANYNTNSNYTMGRKNVAAYI